jgi:hypothetical protein
MGIPAAAGAAGLGTPDPSLGEQANLVASGTFGAVGPGMWTPLYGAFNALCYATLNTSLETTEGSLNATLGSGTGLAAGAGINSKNVPPGTTLASLSGTSAVLALPSIQLTGNIGNSPSTTPGGLAVISGLAETANLLGATVTGPVAAGIPAGTTVAAILQASTPTQPGIVGLSAPCVPTGGLNQNLTFTFALSSQAITTGTDNAAEFTGAGVEFNATVQLERSLDGGKTSVPCNVGGGGQLAQYTANTPYSAVVSEPEQGVLWRWNCLVYSAVTNVKINWRFSATGIAATAWGIPPS